MIRKLGADGRGDRLHWSEERPRTRTISKMRNLFVPGFLTVTFPHLHGGCVIRGYGDHKRWLSRLQILCPYLSLHEHENASKLPAGPPIQAVRLGDIAEKGSRQGIK